MVDWLVSKLVSMMVIMMVSMRQTVVAVQHGVQTDTVLLVSLTVNPLPGWRVRAVGVPGVVVGPVEDPHCDHQDDAHQHHDHHQAAAQYQEGPELLL